MNIYLQPPVTDGGIDFLSKNRKGKCKLKENTAMVSFEYWVPLDLGPEKKGMKVERIWKMEKRTKDRILLRKDLEKWKYKMRERLACLMQKVIRKMIAKKELPTFIEARGNKKSVCLRKEQQMVTNYYIISVS